MAILIKTPKQVDGIRKSCQLAAQTLKYLVSFISEGISTEEINDLAEEYIKEHKAIPAPLNYNGFPKAVCTSVNEVVCHGIPGNYKLKNGDIVNVDVTTILDGYYGDTSTMFVIGEVSETTKKLLEVTKKCLDIGIEQVRPGNFLGNIGYEINNYAVKNGFSTVIQYAGHGVGLKFHEDPQVNHDADRNSGPKLRPNMIFTVEPMINEKGRDCLVLEDGWTAVTRDGGLSAQEEHTILVTNTGYEVLTK